MLRIKNSSTSRLLLCLPLIVSCLGRQAIVEAQEQLATREVRWIEWSAVEPRVQWLAQSTERMKQLPFDGTVTVLVADDGTELVWNLWGERRFTLRDFQKNQQSLQQLSARTVDFDLYVRFNMPTHAFDWTQEERWRQVLDHTKLTAQLASMGRFRGIFLDTEQYGEQVFNQPSPDDGVDIKSLRAKIEQRGVDWMNAIEAELAEPVILMTYGYKAATTTKGDGRPHVKYELLEPFLDGILAAADAKTQVFDGWEYSYGYREEAKFQQAVEEFQTLHRPEHNNRSRVRQAFGLWTDFDPDKYPWKFDKIDENYFSPSGLAQSLKDASKHSHGIVWLYSQNPNWWTGEKLPQAYLDALNQCRR